MTDSIATSSSANSHGAGRTQPTTTAAPAPMAIAPADVPCSILGALCVNSAERLAEHRMRRASSSNRDDLAPALLQCGWPAWLLG